MAYASDRLRERRQKMAMAGPTDDESRPDMPSDRVIALTHPEMQALSGGYQDGQEAVCEVHGKIVNGKLMVSEVRPVGASQEAAPAAPIMRTNPALSPS